jgi:hypothetical protein
MAELTPNQIDEAAKALHLAMSVGERNPSPWETIGYRSQDRYRVMAHDAAPFLQLPWDEPTEEEWSAIFHSIPGSSARSWASSSARSWACEFVRRRNAALLPKPVDPRIAAVLGVLRMPPSTGDEEEVIRILAAIDGAK